jgi:hypothetical protein
MTDFKNLPKVPFSPEKDKILQLEFIGRTLVVSSERDTLFGWKYKNNRSVESNFMDLLDHFHRIIKKEQ